MEQVEKFTARGLEKATDEKNKVAPLTKKHEVAKEREKGRPFPVNYLGKEYQVQFTYEYDPNAAELYDIQVSSDKKKIDIFLNLKDSESLTIFEKNQQDYPKKDIEICLTLDMFSLPIKAKENIITKA